MSPKEKLKIMEEQARLAAQKAVPPVGGNLRWRKHIHSFSSNAKPSVTVVMREVISGNDAAQQYLDSGDGSPEIRALMTKLSKGEKLTEAERAALTDEAKVSKRVYQALNNTANGVSKERDEEVDISSTVQKITINKSISTHGGSCRVLCQVDFANILRRIDPGDRFDVGLDGETLFYGICVSVTRPNEWDIEFVVNDWTWYLRNPIAWIQNKPITLGEAFAKICDTLALPFSITFPPNLPKLKPRVETNSTAMTLLQEMIEETAVATHKQYAIRTNPEILELVDLEGRWENGKLIQEGTRIDVVNCLTTFKSETTIEKDVYNDVRAYVNSGGKINLYNVQDNPSIERYGILRYQEQLNNAVIKEADLDNVLGMTKYPISSFSFSIIGMINLMPCDTICVAESIYLISAITYNITKDGMSMDITTSQWQHPNTDRGINAPYGRYKKVTE